MASQRESRSSTAQLHFHNHMQDSRAKPSQTPQRSAQVESAKPQPTEAWAPMVQVAESPATLSEQDRSRASEMQALNLALPQLSLRTQVEQVLPTQIYRRDSPT